jgi:hypothetical protein
VQILHVSFFFTRPNIFLKISLPLKLCYPSTKLHDVSQKTAIFVVTSVRTSNSSCKLGAHIHFSK